MAPKHTTKRVAAEKMADVERDISVKKNRLVLATASKAISESESDAEIIKEKSGSKRRRATAARNTNVTEKSDKKSKQSQEKKKNEKLKKEEVELEDSGANTSRDELSLLEQSPELYVPRVRKPVDHLDAGMLRLGGRHRYDVQIVKGEGIELKHIPSISFELENSSLEDLKTLHRIMYSRIGIVERVKDNVLNFSGFTFDKDAKLLRKVRTDLSKLTFIKLKCLSQVLCLPKKGKSADYIERILQFLLKPVDTGIAARESRPKRHGAYTKSYKEAASISKEGGFTRSKKKSGYVVKGPCNPEEGFADKGDKNGTAKEVKKAKTEVEEQGEIENELNKAQAETLKENSIAKQSKKQTIVAGIETPLVSVPAKENIGRKQNIPKNAEKILLKAAVLAEKEEEEKEIKLHFSNEEMNMKAKEVEGNVVEKEEEDKQQDRRFPTDDEIKACIKSILDVANIEEITMKTLCQQVFNHYPGHDLSMKKDFMIDTVISLIL
ncbi:protein DEK [Nilaparvata lugens]|uniref:protein DEK n=1 Tax=Nilaparvata lugens TaxID=108931 RepID=UPI00193DCF1E|nr:protein DEK [Nilaparvata lugens]